MSPFRTKGYSEVNVLAHSWGTNVTHQALNTGLSAPVNDWVTFGSPLRGNAPRPLAVNANWVDAYSDYDAVTWLEVFPPYQLAPDPRNTFAGGTALRAGAVPFDLTGFLNTPAGTPIGQFYFYTQGPGWVAEHGDYWTRSRFLREAAREIQ